MQSHLGAFSPARLLTIHLSEIINKAKVADILYWIMIITIKRIDEIAHVEIVLDKWSI